MAVKSNYRELTGAAMATAVTIAGYAAQTNQRHLGEADMVDDPELD
jgi:hypothetical protein